MGDISRADFTKLFWNLNPDATESHHNQENCYIEYLKIVNNEITDFNGDIVDCDYLAGRWKRYVLNWQKKYKNTDESFIGKANKLKSLYIYLTEKHYFNDVMEFNPEADPRFKILFDNKSPEEIEKSFQIFRNDLK